MLVSPQFVMHALSDLYASVTWQIMWKCLFRFVALAWSYIYENFSGTHSACEHGIAAARTPYASAVSLLSLQPTLIMESSKDSTISNAAMNGSGRLPFFSVALSSLRLSVAPRFWTRIALGWRSHQLPAYPPIVCTPSLGLCFRFGVAFVYNGTFACTYLPPKVELWTTFLQTKLWVHRGNAECSHNINR